MSAPGKDAGWELLREMTDLAGRLRDVERLIPRDLPRDTAALILSFEHGTFTIVAVTDDDSIALQRGRLHFEEEYELVSIVHHEPWCRALGNNVRWGWAMTNQQGYADAVQLEFVVSGDGLSVQLICVASSLRTYEAHEVRTSDGKV